MLVEIDLEKNQFLSIVFLIAISKNTFKFTPAENCIPSFAIIIPSKLFSHKSCARSKPSALC